EYTSYTVDPQTNLIDYDEVRKRAREERPLLLIAGYSSYPRKINFRTFREIADEVGATFMVDMAHFAGLVAGKVYTGDFDPGRHAEGALRSAGVTLNRNVIPYDTNGSWYTSGLRIGTPAVTTLGMGTAEMEEIASIIASVLRATSPTKTASGKPSLANYTLE